MSDKLLKKTNGTNLYLLVLDIYQDNLLDIRNKLTDELKANIKIIVVMIKNNVFCTVRGNL